MTTPDDEVEGAHWDWVDIRSGMPSGAVQRRAADRIEAALPQPSTADLRDLEARLGRDRLISELTGGTASKPKGSSKIAGDAGAWTRARKWLSDHIGSQRRSKIGEPYRSRLAKLIIPPTIRVSMTIHARVSNKDKHLYVRDLVMSNPEKDEYLSDARSRDPDSAIYTLLTVWGSGMQDRVTRVYDVDKVKVGS